MCGIAGILSADRREAIGRMTEALVHRGPDDSGFYVDERIALGHRRLSIVDVDGGRQPIANEDGSLQLICNGEIYNSPELRTRLERDGHRFRTRTDVEVILHLYEERGRDCVRELRGMFAFALWDTRRKGLLLARDHLGQKPLFFWEGEGQFAFASEVKGLLAGGFVRAEPDLEGLWHYVSLRFIPDQYTLFRRIRKLPPATTLWYEGERWSTERYWRLDFRNKLSGSEADLEEALHAVLLDAVRTHLMSDVRVGAFLSGGIDSSTVAAMMARSSAEPVPTFSIGVEEQGFNELPYAAKVASQYGMEAHEQVVKADLVRLIPELIHHMDEPSDPYGVGVYLVSRLAAGHVKVVLGGDGGDESFAGYDRFAGQRLAEQYAWLPLWFRKQVMSRLIDRLPESFGYKSLAKKVRWLHEMSFFTGGERYAQSLSTLRFTQEAKESLFTPEARAQVGDYDSTAKILCHFEADTVDDFVDRMLNTDLMTRMPDHLLVLGDRMSMAHSLELRSPLVDHKVVEFAASLPADTKLKGRSLKRILRKVARRYLPADIVDRPKQGFGFPLGPWMRGELSGFLRRIFADSRMVGAGLLDGGEIHRYLDEHVSGRADHNFRLWILMNLEFWHRLYFDGSSVSAASEEIEELLEGAAADPRG